MRTNIDAYAVGLGPPSSPPIKILLNIKIIKQVTEQAKKTITEQERLPGGVMYCSGGDLVSWYVEAITHGNPRPRNTFTEFDPVTFPTAESALSDVFAAVILANVSGNEVPRATIVMAVIDLGIPTAQPHNAATSPTIAVIPPMKIKAIKKAG